MARALYLGAQLISAKNRTFPRPRPERRRPPIADSKEASSLGRRIVSSWYLWFTEEISMVRVPHSKFLLSLVKPVMLRIMSPHSLLWKSSPSFGERRQGLRAARATLFRKGR